MNKTGIEWTDFSSNPIYALDKEIGKRGWFCEKVSPGCAHCYAATLNRRWGNGLDYLPANRDKVEFRLDERELQRILRRRKPTRIFVGDMLDLFHDEIPDEFIQRVFITMEAAPHHVFQVLTKRPERMRALLADSTFRRGVESAFGSWPLSNVWLGVSAENQRWADERIPLLLDTPAAVPFVSCEPLLGPVNLGTLVYHFPGPGHTAIDWVIVGGESGAMSTRGGPERALVERCHDRRPPTYHLHVDGHDIGHRVCTGWRPKAEALEWVRSLRDQCVAAGVPFFFKQWGGPTPKAAGALLDGREWREMPDASG